MEKNKIGHPIDLILIGGSAGSLKVVLKLLDKQRPGFSIPILLVLHRDPQGSTHLAKLFANRTSMTVKEIEDKDPILDGHLYICPADYHVLVEADQTLSLDYSEKEHYSRPSIDVALCAAADAYAGRLLCILLSGANSDGAEGLSYAKQRNCLTIIQDPKDAQVSYMPEQAILQSSADHVYDSDAIADFLNHLPEA
ncbi:MAG TPA: chemotaxis protein CheB [Chitinophagaceae bacterium]|nr:chemotaxis protein CheB [Chitinophagaceae bacterium]